MKNLHNKIPIWGVMTTLWTLSLPLSAVETLPTTNPPATLATDEPQGVSPTTEIMLHNQSPSVRDVTIKLEGTEREEEQLLVLRGMVRELLSTARQKVERVAAEAAETAAPNRVSENTEILISAKYPMAAGHPYKVSVKLRRSGVEGTPQFFDYYPDKRVLMYQQLQTFLAEQLNLEFPHSVAPPAPKPVPVPVVTPPVTQSAEPVTLAKEVPESPPAVKPILPVEMPPVVQETPPLSEEEPKGVRAATEIELKNVTPAVKSVSITLEGTEREEVQLQVVRGMIREILQSAKLEVVQVPHTEETLNTHTVKVYQNLEIVVAMRAPDDEATQPYQVTITLREQGSSGGKSQPFEFFLAKKEEFYQKLRAYLIENVNLSPRS